MKVIQQVLDFIMPKRESQIDNEFREKLKDLPFPVAAKKIKGGGHDINEPDWFICVLGRLVLIETKRDLSTDKTKKARKEGQRIRAKWWKRAGARYFICDNADRMIEAVKQVYNEQRRLLDSEGEDIY